MCDSFVKIGFCRRCTYFVAMKKPIDKPIWAKPAPKDKAKVKLSPEQIAMARERAEKAGRRYPNLVDNIWAAKLAVQEKDLP